MGAADCGESHQPGAKDEASAARPEKVPVRLTQSPVKPANDSEQNFLQERGADKAGPQVDSRRLSSDTRTARARRSFQQNGMTSL